MLEYKEGWVSIKCFSYIYSRVLVVLRLFYKLNEMYKSGISYGL